MAPFAKGMARVFHDPAQGIAEDAGSFLKRNAMLCPVARRFPGIPFES
jgi:hypothetical protein